MHPGGSPGGYEFVVLGELGLVGGCLLWEKVGEVFDCCRELWRLDEGRRRERWCGDGQSVSPDKP